MTVVTDPPDSGPKDGACATQAASHSINTQKQVDIARVKMIQVTHKVVHLPHRHITEMATKGGAAVKGVGIAHG